MKIFCYLASLSFLLAVAQYMYTDILQLKMAPSIAWIIISLQGILFFCYILLLALFLLVIKKEKE